LLSTKRVDPSRGVSFLQNGTWLSSTSLGGRHASNAAARYADRVVRRAVLEVDRAGDVIGHRPPLGGASPEDGDGLESLGFDALDGVRELLSKAREELDPDGDHARPENGVPRSYPFI